MEPKLSDQVFVAKTDGEDSFICDICQESTPFGFTAAVLAVEDKYWYAHPGLYHWLATLCRACASSPSIAISQALSRLKRIAVNKNSASLDRLSLILSYVHATEGYGSGYLRLPPDAIVLPVRDWEDLKFKDGGWQVVEAALGVGAEEE